MRRPRRRLPSRRRSRPRAPSARAATGRAPAGPAARSRAASAPSSSGHPRPDRQRSTAVPSRSRPTAFQAISPRQSGSGRRRPVPVRRAPSPRGGARRCRRHARCSPSKQHRLPALPVEREDRPAPAGPAVVPGDRGPSTSCPSTTRPPTSRTCQASPIWPPGMSATGSIAAAPGAEPSQQRSGPGREVGRRGHRRRTGRREARTRSRTAPASRWRGAASRHRPAPGRPASTTTVRVIPSGSRIRCCSSVGPVRGVAPPAPARGRAGRRPGWSSGRRPAGSAGSSGSRRAGRRRSRRTGCRCRPPGARPSALDAVGKGGRPAVWVASCRSVLAPAGVPASSGR